MLVEPQKTARKLKKAFFFNALPENADVEIVPLPGSKGCNHKFVFRSMPHPKRRKNYHQGSFYLEAYFSR
jgi:hypothetical protein